MRLDIKTSGQKVIITVALVGARTTRKQNPSVPITPREIAEGAVESAKEGAAVCHIHVRDLKTHDYSMDLALYQEVVDRIRDRSDILINLTTGPGGRLSFSKEKGWDVKELASPEERVRHVLKLRPELCSLDMGTINFGDTAFVNLSSHVEQMAQMITQAKVKPELEIFDAGHLRFATHLIKKGFIAEPPLFQLCLGIPWGMDASLNNLLHLCSLLPKNAVWYGLGIGAAQFPLAAIAIMAGGHVRVGMEDNVYLSKNILAKSNAELVSKAVKIAELFDREVATPKEAKAILGIE